MPSSFQLILLLLAFTVSFLATHFFMPRLLDLCRRRGLYDMPNERKVHHNKIPRLGGLLFAPCMGLGMAAAYALLAAYEPQEELPVFRLSTMLLIVGLFMIYLVGILDDILGLKASFKFTIQLAATLFMPLCGLYINNLYGFCGIYEIPLWMSYPLTVFICLLIVNSVNLIDGIDGLSSGLSMIALSAFALLFWQLHVIAYTLLAVGLVGSVLSFFFFNMFGSESKGTKTFMGDTGSLVLGYALAYLSIKYAMHNPHVLPLRPHGFLVAYTLLIVPCFDLTRVAFGRLLRREGIFHPDKSHLHHRCLAAGFSMHQSLALILLLQAVLNVLNLGGYFLLHIDTTVIVVVDIVVFTAFVAWLNARSRKRLKTNISSIGT
ncbi:undecaprenyl/decaprenyl-phosphate alpha-N-acetylglucosaminyl 1-phosphate transferase [Alloprevotella sp. OH1205_COT-284]|uniref:MraY family glycosyltransferase n=1 Tax=Alloprevotella sp. OH1205_COT-284 TaxID=2491043 RepID=UPI000F5FE999|nr:MraY family glycosyltransferase [Alloprevotella sp. OH1205_COT-284]RRD79501.1 undecaprenyl/decaprenyl-phosphate alpha-N-acetylglucosaminyl 1-phosphate transferase [Alloprevotella sp. OH1205_COT-284]